MLQLSGLHFCIVMVGKLAVSDVHGLCTRDVVEAWVGFRKPAPSYRRYWHLHGLTAVIAKRGLRALSTVCSLDSKPAQPVSPENIWLKICRESGWTCPIPFAGNSH